ncbi:MAG TPA: ABC transporter permease [Chryseosolibacter sp.]
MFTNYFRIAYRTLLKHRSFSVINTFGLAIAMAAFLFISRYIIFERSYEDFHKNSENILRLTTEFYNGSEYIVTDCETYAPLGPLLKDKMPEVVDFVRMYGIDGLVSVRAGTKNFLERGLYWADHSAFDVFTYDVLNGDAAKALTAPFEVVVTESMARKYFGRTNVTDEAIEIDKNLYRIKAVIADLPPNTHLKFSFLLSRLSLKTLKPWYPDDRWNNNNEFTYVLTVPRTNVALFNEKVSKLVKRELKGVLTDVEFVAEPIRDIHLYSTKSFEPEASGNGRVVFYLSLIGIFIIAIAWVNYINLSTARSVERAREVGIRKVMGSLKNQLVLQFLSESIILNVLAGILALILFQATFPFLRDLSGQPLPFETLGKMSFWLLFLPLIAVGSLLSGLYPAFVLASFSPVTVLKGKFKSSSQGQVLREALVIFQFSATVILIISLATVYLQVNFLRNYDLGMNIDQTLVLAGKQNVPDSLAKLASESLRAELLKNPQIVSVARAESLPGIDIQEVSTTMVLPIGSNKKQGEGYVYYYIGVDAGFVSTLKLKFAAGRNFEDSRPNNDAVILNEEAVRMLGFSSAEEAVGSMVTFRTRAGTGGSTIIGVLKNFYFRSPKEAHLPMLFYYRETSDYFALNVRSADVQHTLASVEAVWKKVYPNAVFDYFFLNERYDQQYRADAQFGKVMAAFSALTIFIACLGLFGLSSYTITQRTKEIGIRKVLGCSVMGIVRLLSIDFAKTVFIAALIALPVAWFAMQQWLSNYAVRITLSAWVFILAVAAIMLLGLLTVSSQTIKTATNNPVNSLKQE